MNGSNGSIPVLLDDLSREHGALLPELRALAELAESDAPGLAAAVAGLGGRLTQELDQHIAREDQVLFPAIEAATGNSDLVQHFVDEHRRIQILRDALLTGSATGAPRLALQRQILDLADLLAGHMDREDMMLFPMTRDMLG